MSKLSIQYIKIASVFILGAIIYFSPVPQGLDPRAWHLFAIFISTIFAVIINALPILVASISALTIAIFTKTLVPIDAYSGFSQGFILLILIAFLVAKGVVKSGLGTRFAYLMIKTFGKSTLGLSYSIMITDCLIAPAFPSNTARSGVLFPIVQSLAIDSGSTTDSEESKKKMGSFLMMCAMASLTISSGLWLTAMAANPSGVAMAKELGVNITFGSWLLYASVPSLTAFILIPLILYKTFPPTVKNTPQAPVAAAKKLKEMGPLSKDEWVMGITFFMLVLGWGFSGILHIDKTAIAFCGLAVLMISKVFTLEDLKHEGSALGTFIWFAILYTLSTYLNRYGFMSYIGEHIRHSLIGLSWPVIYVSLITIYVLIHYLFVSQTAQMLALFGVFLGVGINAGVPGILMAMMLLFATNFNAMVTPQGSSANVLFAGSGYLSTGDIYKQGAIVTLSNLLIYLVVGSFWILLVS